MPGQPITPHQLEVLRRIVADDPADRPKSRDAQTVYALRTRGLVTTRHRTSYWLAAATDEGRKVVAAADKAEAQHAAEPLDTDAIKSVDQLLDTLNGGGGRVIVADPVRAERSRWRKLVYAVQGHAAVPEGMRVRHAGRDSGDFAVWLEAVAPEPSGPAPVPIPRQLRNPHPAISKLREMTLNPDGWLDTIGLPAVAHVRVHRDQRQRTNLILHALCTEAERRGHELTTREPPAKSYHQNQRNSKGLRIGIDGHLFEFSIVEETDRVPHVATKAELADAARYSWTRIPEWDRVPSGRLVIREGSGSIAQPLAADRKRWSLDDRLGHVLATLEESAAAATLHALEEQRKAEQRHAEWEVAVAKATERWTEQKKGEHLEGLTERHRMANDIRSMVAAAEAAGGADPDWMAWARAHAERIDPAANGAFTPPAFGDPEPTELQPFMPAGFWADDPQRRPLQW